MNKEKKGIMALSPFSLHRREAHQLMMSHG
jgi:hypothetical protein